MSMNWQISIKKEKAIVLVGAIMSAATGYLTGIGYVSEATLIGAITAAVLAFWSEGVNTQ